MSKKNKSVKNSFHLDFKTSAQKIAWGEFQQHDVLFLSGPAGTGKTFLAMAFAIEQVLKGKQQKIILTRPIVESGEKLGYLPGSFQEKVNPYMAPLYDAMQKLFGDNKVVFDFLQERIEIAPIAYLRGRSFDNAVCILDEAQNATKSQIKLFLTRFGENSKIIITGDPSQKDIIDSGFLDTMKLLETVEGIAMVYFGAESIVRNKLIIKILEKLN